MMRTLFAREVLEKEVDPWHTDSIFLAGPTLRNRSCRVCKGGKPYGRESCRRCDDARDFRERSWREDALELLASHEGLVVIPEDRGWTYDEATAWEAQVDWELEWLEAARVVLFWVPRHLELLPGFTTNVEFGYLVGRHPERVVLGIPPGAPNTNYLKHLASKKRVPVYDTLAATIGAAVAQARPPYFRPKTTRP